MPELLQSLLKQDIGHLRIIAEFWGIELESTTADDAREELSASLLDAELIGELVESLSPQAQSALRALVKAEGRIPWAVFTRQYGDIREMGAAKRDRERPHLKPASTAESLYYRGLLARAFFDDDKGPQEFAYIPDDLLEQLYNIFDEEVVDEPVEVKAISSRRRQQPKPKRWAALPLPVKRAGRSWPTIPFSTMRPPSSPRCAWAGLWSPPAR